MRCKQMPEEKVIQHYVPCCYLANFGINGNKKRESIIFAFDVNTKKVSEGKVESFANIKRFYDIDFPDNPKLIEDFFTNLEGDFDQIVKQVLAISKKKTISINQKEELAVQFAFLFVRTKAFRDRYDSMIKQLSTIMPQNYLEDFYRDKKAFLRSVHTYEILSMKEANFFANMLLDRKWIIWRNRTETPFFTSDNPVCVIFHEDENASIVAPTVEIYIPLSPNLSISAYHKDINDSIFDRSVCEIKDSRLVNGFNLHMTKNCSRFVFSNKNTFDSFMKEEQS